MHAHNESSSGELVSNYKEEMAHFVYKLSHDLQTPLRTIIGFSNLVLATAKEKLTEQESSDMEVVINAAKHAQALIETLLSYSRLTVQFRPVEAVDMNNLVKDVLLEMNNTIVKHQATITYDPLPVIYGDPVQLRLVLTHLIDNTVKFCQKARPPIVHISAIYEKKQHYWLFRISDNGIGIDPKYQAVVFELFKQLHAIGTYPGLGAGLAFVKKIIELHHGTVGIDSAPDKGTTVWFTLPE